MTINDPLSWTCKVMYYTLPFSRMSLVLIRGAIALSTRMVVLAFVHCNRPIGMSGFQNVALPQNLIPFVEVAQFASLRWCSWKSKICNGVDYAVSQVLITFCLGEFFPNPFTFNEARVRGFLIMSIHLGQRLRRTILVVGCISGGGPFPFPCLCLDPERWWECWR
jgi:hypothetical protein